MISEAQLIVRIREEQEKLSRSVMLYPSASDHMVQAGKWQGLELSIKMVEEILRDDEELER